MNLFRTRRAAPEPVPAATAPVARRSLVVGAGVAGAAALAATALHRQAVEVLPAVEGNSAAAGDGGYRVTPHVLRYYETTRA